MSANFDFDTLWEDFDTVVALESRGIGIENPMMRSIAKRWCVLDDIEQEVVAQESRAMMERAQTVADGAAEGTLAKKFAKDAGRSMGKAAVGATKLAGKGAGKVAKAAGKGVGAVSAALGEKFKEWAKHYGGKFKDKLADMVNKATMMEKQRSKLLQRLDEAKDLSGNPIKTMAWVSCICVLDKVSFDACIHLSAHTGDLDHAVEQYTVKVRQYEGLLVGRYKEYADGTLEKISYPSNAAIHRASGILGRFTQDDVKARPLAGNVIIVTHGKGVKEKVEFAVAREAKLGATINPLSKEQCKKALEGVKHLTTALADRGVKRKVFSYSGIYHEIEEMESKLESLEGEELRAAMLLYKNSMAMEDAFTTAMTRTGDGLLNWVSASLKG